MHADAESAAASGCRTLHGSSARLRPLRPGGRRTTDAGATVTFVAPADYDVPVGALRRILNLMIGEATTSSGPAAT